MNDCGLMEWTCSEEINEVSCDLSNVDPQDDLCADYCSNNILKQGSCNQITYNCDFTDYNCDDTRYSATVKKRAATHNVKQAHQ